MQILEAQQRIAAGEQFATVATQMSEDKARQGGDLGWKRRQEVVGAFADAAFKLEVTLLHVLIVVLLAYRCSTRLLGYLPGVPNLALYATCTNIVGTKMHPP